MAHGKMVLDGIRLSIARWVTCQARCKMGDAIQAIEGGWNLVTADDRFPYRDAKYFFFMNDGRLELRAAVVSRDGSSDTLEYSYWPDGSKLVSTWPRWFFRETGPLELELFVLIPNGTLRRSRWSVGVDGDVAALRFINLGPSGAAGDAVGHFSRRLLGYTSH